jgi:hypothetical protein
MKFLRNVRLRKKSLKNKLNVKKNWQLNLLLKVLLMLLHLQKEQKLQLQQLLREKEDIGCIDDSFAILS